MWNIKTGAPDCMWLQNPTIAFYIHRSFQWQVLLTNLFILSQ
jgi:cytochrome c oxidase assembly protein subunit 15